MKIFLGIILVILLSSCSTTKETSHVNGKFNQAEQYFDHLHSNSCKTDSIRRVLLTY